jgi:hypothetical protein
MSDRDDLAELIRETCWPAWKYPATPDSLADAIMAAGWMNMHALQDDLDELEAEDPDVKAAAEAYDAMVREVTRPATAAVLAYADSIDHPDHRICVTCTSAVCVCGVER